MEVEVTYTYDNGFGCEWDVTAWFKIINDNTIELLDMEYNGEVSHQTEECMTEQGEALAWLKWEAAKQMGADR
jgi:hypothetical protein